MRNGHIIKECPTRLKNRRAQAFQAAVVNHQIPGSTSTTTVTLEMVQQMIIIAFSTLGLQGQGNLSIEQYYSGFVYLWSEYSGIIYSKVSKEPLPSLQVVHEVSKRD